MFTIRWPHPLVFREQVSSRNSEGFPRAGALNEGGVGKIGDFRHLSHHISETVQDRTKVAIDHLYKCVHVLSIGTKINDLE